MTEDADHDMAVLLVLIDLVGAHAHQPLLVGGERERVFDAALHDEGVERTADIVGNAEAVTALDNRTVLGGGDHDDWQLLDPAELIQALEHAEAVDFRHIDIQQQQVDIHILLEHEDGLRTVLCLRVVIFLAEDCLEHFSVEFPVVNNQNFLSVHSRFDRSRVGLPPFVYRNLTGFTIFYYTTNAMQNKGKFPSAPTAEISVVQECGSVYNEE